MFCLILVDMAGGINNFSPMIGNNASLLMKNLQQLIASNPAYLTSGIPTHLIQQMWKNDPDPMQAKMNPMEEDEGDDEEMGVAETYADYWPSKCKTSCIHQCQSIAQC